LTHVYTTYCVRVSDDYHIFYIYCGYLSEADSPIIILLDYNIAEFFYLLFFDFSHLTKTANGGGAGRGDRGADGLAGEGWRTPCPALP
jgi:hypothetical protein